MEAKNYHIRQKGKHAVYNYLELWQIFLGIPFATPSYIGTTRNSPSTSSSFEECGTVTDCQWED